VIDCREDQDREAQKWIEDQTKYEDAHLGNFRRIYPSEGSEKYDKFFHSSGSLYQETASFKARSECARYMTPVQARTGSSNRHWLSRQTGPISSGVTRRGCTNIQVQLFFPSKGPMDTSAVPRSPFIFLDLCLPPPSPYLYSIRRK